MSGPAQDALLERFSAGRSEAGKFAVEGAKQLPEIPGAFAHPLTEMPASGDVLTRAANVAPWAGVVAGIVGLSSGKPFDEVMGGLKVSGAVSDLGARVASNASQAGSGKLVAGLGASGALFGIGQQWWEAFAGGGKAIQEGVENAAREGKEWGIASGFAASLLAMRPDWVDQYGPIHAVHSGLPSQNRAEDSRIEAYKAGKAEGYAAGQALPNDTALAILSEALRYARERDVYQFGTRDQWEGWVNLVERVLPQMAREVRAGTWELKEAPEPSSEAGETGQAVEKSPGTEGQTGEAGQEGAAPQAAQAPQAPQAGQAGQAAQAPQAAAGESGPSGNAAVNAGATVVLGAGDTIWSLAEGALMTAWGREPTGPEVTSYVPLLIAANLDRLLNPDANQGFSGQVLVLPPVPKDDDSQSAADEAAESSADIVESEQSDAGSQGPQGDVAPSEPAAGQAEAGGEPQSSSGQTVSTDTEGQGAPQPTTDSESAPPPGQVGAPPSPAEQPQETHGQSTDEHPVPSKDASSESKSESDSYGSNQDGSPIGKQDADSHPVPSADAAGRDDAAEQQAEQEAAQRQQEIQQEQQAEQAQEQQAQQQAAEQAVGGDGGGGGDG